MALPANSMGRMDIQVKIIRVERDRQSVVSEPCYGRHEADLNHAAGWYRTLWQDSNPHETHLIKMYRPILKDNVMGPTIRRRQRLLRRMRSSRAGGSCDILTLTKSLVSNRPCTATEDFNTP